MRASVNTLFLKRLLAACMVAAVCHGAASGHGDLDERIAKLTADLALAPLDAGLHFQLAEIQCQHGDEAKTLKALAHVEELAPGKFPTNLLRGKATLEAGHALEAKTALSRFLAEHGSNPAALVLRAKAFELLNQSELCLADYRAALAASEHPEPDLFSEAAEALAFRGHEEEAIGVLSSGIKRLGTVPSLVLKVIDLEAGAKHFESALQRVDAMRESAPRPEPWTARRAALLDKAGRHEEALAEWKALALHIATLPAAQRGSRSMCLLAEQAQQALQRSLNPVFP